MSKISELADDSSVEQTLSSYIDKYVSHAGKAELIPLEELMAM